MDTNQTFTTEITVKPNGTAELRNVLDGDKEMIVPVMAMAFIEGIKAGDPVVIEGFEILQSVCLSVLDGLPGLKARESVKTFTGRDHFKGGKL